MQRTPFRYVCQGTLWKFSIDPTGSYFDRNFKITVNGVKVRRSMIAVVQGNNDAEEAADFRHAYLLKQACSHIVNDARRLPKAAYK